MASQWLREMAQQAQAGPSAFDGRLLTARDLTRDQSTQVVESAAGRTTFKEFTVTKKTDASGTILDGAAADLLGLDTGIDHGAAPSWMQGDQIF